MATSDSSARRNKIVTTLLANLLSIHMGVIFSWTITIYYQLEWTMVKLLENRLRKLSEAAEYFTSETTMGDEVLVLLTEVEQLHKVLPEHGSFVFEFLKRLPFILILAALPLGAYISERFGRKKALILSVIPSALCFGLLIVAQDFLWMLGAMTFGGVACALQFYIIPIYVNEISNHRKSGVHSVIQTMFIGIGILFGQLLTLLWASNIVALISVILSGGFLILLIMKLPESPVWLTRHNRTSEAIRVGTTLQLDGQSPKSEAEKLNEEEGNVQPPNPQQLQFHKMFACPEARKGFLVSVGLLVGQALLQINIIPAVIATSVGIGMFISDFPDIAFIPSLGISIVILIAVCIVTSLLTNPIGRRTLLIVSCICMTIALLMAGGLNPIQRKPDDNPPSFHTPLTELLSDVLEHLKSYPHFSYEIDNIYLTLLIGITYYIFYFLGVSVLSVISVEIIPNNAVSYVYATSMGIFWIVTWIVAEIFTSCTSTLFEYMRYFWFGQAMICVLLLIFVCLCVPRSMNKPTPTSGRVYSS